MKLTTRQIAQTGILLAICIVSQFFKNVSVYLTGPIVNTAIIIGVLAAGLFSGLVIALLAPVTAYLIAASPIISAIPAVLPMIMAGNCILAVCVWFFTAKLKFSGNLPAGMAAGCVLKTCFMTLSIVQVLFTIYGASLSDKQLAMGKTMFSVTQLITAAAGSLLAFIIWIPLKKFLKKES
mgnify:FL=1